MLSKTAFYLQPLIDGAKTTGRQHHLSRVVTVHILAQYQVVLHCNQLQPLKVDMCYKHCCTMADNAKRPQLLSTSSTGCIQLPVRQILLR